MSNFSGVYELYLQGYAGFEYGVKAGTGYPMTERLCQALALGVYHRVALKPPLMRSVDVVAEMKRMRTPAQTHFDVTLQAIIGQGQVIPAIKVIREITSLGLKEAKDVVDRVMGTYRKVYSDKPEPAQPQIVLASVERAKADVVAKALRDVGCTVEIR